MDEELQQLRDEEFEEEAHIEAILQAEILRDSLREDGKLV